MPKKGEKLIPFAEKVNILLDPQVQACSQKHDAGERVPVGDVLEEVAERYGVPHAYVYNLWRDRAVILHDWRLLNELTDEQIAAYQDRYISGEPIPGIVAFLQSGSGRYEFRRRYFVGYVYLQRKKILEQKCGQQDSFAPATRSKQPDFSGENMDIPEATFRMSGNAYRTAALPASGLADV